jgi:hypothetical protein
MWGDKPKALSTFFNAMCDGEQGQNYLGSSMLSHSIPSSVLLWSKIRLMAVGVSKMEADCQSSPVGVPGLSTSRLVFQSAMRGIGAR